MLHSLIDMYQKGSVLIRFSAVIRFLHAKMLCENLFGAILMLSNGAFYESNRSWFRPNRYYVSQSGTRRAWLRSLLPHDRGLRAPRTPTTMGGRYRRRTSRLGEDL